MEAVIIVAPRNYGSVLQSRIPKCYDVTRRADGSIIVDDGSTRIYVIQHDSIPHDFDANELKAVQAVVEDPQFFAVEFSDIEFCRKFLVVIADDSRLIVDNDHGVLLRGSEFAQVLRSRSDWDWRVESLPV